MKTTVRVTITTEDGEVLENFAATREEPPSAWARPVRLAADVRDYIERKFDTNEDHVR